ncbi:MAG: hypothetical protein QM775_32760 [Pirellulales bacterium]
MGAAHHVHATGEAACCDDHPQAAHDDEHAHHDHHHSTAGCESLAAEHAHEPADDAAPPHEPCDEHRCSFVTGSFFAATEFSDGLALARMFTVGDELRDELQRISRRAALSPRDVRPPPLRSHLVLGILLI